MTYDWANWTKVENQECDVKIEKVDDNTISIYNFYGWEETFTAKCKKRTISTHSKR